MKRATDKLIALQFLAVVLPIAVVLLVQMVVDARRASALEHSRPLRILADEIRTEYKTFTNGAADAVDTGTLGAQSVEALHAAAARLAELSERGEAAAVGDAAAVVTNLAAIIPKGATLNNLMPLRERILQGDRLTKAINDEFERRDEFVVKDAIASAVRQKRAVIVALILSAILTVWFVSATRRRLKARLEADISAERKQRAEIEAISLRVGIATRAARAGVYELKNDGLELWWSDTMHELYAQPSAAFRPTMNSWLGLIHVDDRELAQTAISTAMREQRQLRSEYRIVRPDGSICHIASLAAVVMDSIDAKPRLVGIDLDITARVEADERERQLQQQLRDASRQAGMAEIATNVLHNVGNVLNSVNISASVLADKIKNPRAAGLGKVAALLRERAADLGTFVSADPRGKQLPLYLTQLSEQLILDQRLTLEELESLRKNIDHIKEIVTMQQTYSKRVGVPEKLAVTSLADDALRMNVGAFTRHGVALKCEFEDVPEIVVERHKVLQILVNLLRNAKYACEASDRKDKQVLMRIASHVDGVQIAISDNGIGIRPEHMPQIFCHGFTTKEDGHGFGLHSGALAAREMGGGLRVESAGRGHGATFTLELPLKSPELLYG
ncbi:MAG TPA: ATP-binding protein [Steroidobacteraceae bacterium]|jgi:signal transduction histidine kinase|nr:ATP-binding protein [Steroidobacteraceae bacterium]